MDSSYLVQIWLFSDFVCICLVCRVLFLKCGVCAPVSRCVSARPLSLSLSLSVRACLRVSPSLPLYLFVALSIYTVYRH